MIAQIRRDGFLWQQTYSEGLCTSNLMQLRPLEPNETTGTAITFTPDFTVFEPNEFSYTTLAKRFRELAYLVPGLTITLKDEREQPEGTEVDFYAPNGLADYVAYLNRDYRVIHQPIHRREQVEAKKSYEESVTVDVEIAFQFVEQPQTLVLSYANTEATIEGGTHVDGLLEGIETVFNTVFIDQQLVKKYEDRLTIHEMMPGLTAVVSILHPQILHVDKSGREITNTEVCYAVTDVVVDAVDEFAQQHPAEMQQLVDHLLARKQERDQRRFGE
jgi:DNA gyrase subunit B